MRDENEAAALAGLAGQAGQRSTALLTTFRAEGTAVSTPVSVTVRGTRAYFVTATDSRKAVRLSRDDRLELTPCTVAGAPRGRTVTGRAQSLNRSAVRSLGLLRPTGPLFWTWLGYRLRGHRMTFFEITSQ